MKIKVYHKNGELWIKANCSLVKLRAYLTELADKAVLLKHKEREHQQRAGEK